MAWINVISPDSATGPLKRQYDEATARAGRIWNIVSIMGQNPMVLKASMEMYMAIMFGPSPLTRRQREMIAVIVSAENRCVY